MTKKKTAILALALILCVGIVSAGLLSYYAKINTTVDVAQGILVDGQGYEPPIEEAVPAVGGSFVYRVHTIQNLGDKAATVYLSWESNDTEGIDVTYFVNQATLTLENKNSTTWGIIEDYTKGTLTYSIVGNTFSYTFVATGLQPNTEYSLIYYADFEDRFAYWGGNNPGALIGTMITNINGNVSTSGSKDLGIDLPSYQDANRAIYDYSGAPDFYDHAHGAKIWLVPSSDYNAADKTIYPNWKPTTYLFETDLITYLDLDGVSIHLLHPDPTTTTEITIPAHSTVSFVIRFEFTANAIGTYLVTTTVSP